MFTRINKYSRKCNCNVKFKNSTLFQNIIIVYTITNLVNNQSTAHGINKFRQHFILRRRFNDGVTTVDGLSKSP